MQEGQEIIVTTHPFDRYDDKELYERLRFRRADITRIVDEIGPRIEQANRGHTVL